MSTNAFDRLAPFITEYIYRKKWTELREVQVAAIEVVFDTDCNLLLASGTASGKTEAAFLPVLSKLHNSPSESVGVLYISPLKALINDQFNRLEELLQEANIPVHKWHGDVSQNNKNKLLKEPKGIIQTTPESLEGMLMRRKSSVIKLFSDLKFIIIDEVHNFMSNDRGIQLLCIIERIQLITGITPRRIGLSATLGDYSSAERWLNAGSGRICKTPKTGSQKNKIRLALEHFWEEKESNDNNANDVNEGLSQKELLGGDKYLNFLYDSTYGKRCIIFANSKAQIEENIANLKMIANKKKVPDNYFIHHGSLSQTIREHAEETMKNSEKPIVIGATVTLELGIDIGALERIVQCGSPDTVSSFVQRLGRTGRRGEPAEMWFAFHEEMHTAKAPFYEIINWDFIRCIAIIQLYLEEKWIEPLRDIKYPYGIVYHQTMSTIASLGEIAPANLAKNILSLSGFMNVSQDDYKLLLRHLIEIDQLQKTERGNLIVGLAGEKEINSFRFLAVFTNPNEYSVICGAENIGSVEEPFPKGVRFMLAAKTWEVIDLDKDRKNIYVKAIKGKSKINWSGGGGIEHTKILKKIKNILMTDEKYPYLNQNAIKRLNEIRDVAAKNLILMETVIFIGGKKYAVFPWLGTRSLYTLKLSLAKKNFNSKYVGLSIPICLLVETNRSKEELENALLEIKKESINKYSFELEKGIAMPCKFNNFVPEMLLQKQFIEDYVDITDMQNNLII